MDYSISGLYYRYGRTSNEDIKECLTKVKIFLYEQKASGHGYYQIDPTVIQKVIENEKPRSIAFAFDNYSTFGDPITDYTITKHITFLVKSSSRFFLKPDFGEVLDQINFIDLCAMNFNGIILNGTVHELLPGTEGEHFIMNATLIWITDEYVTGS